MSADAGNRGNLRVSPAKAGAQRHKKHGEHRDGCGAIGEMQA